MNVLEEWYCCTKLIGTVVQNCSCAEQKHSKIEKQGEQKHFKIVGFFSKEVEQSSSEKETNISRIFVNVAHGRDSCPMNSSNFDLNQILIALDI